MVINYSKISKQYSSGFSLQIEKLEFKTGEIIGLVGNNGAGKTTLLKLSVDLISPNSGTIKIDKIKINESEFWKEHLGVFISTEFLIPFLRPLEYFYFIGKLFNYTEKQVDSILSRYDNFIKDEVLNQGGKLIRNFSNGNQVKIGIIAAMMFNPSILLLDEPFTGLDPTSQVILKQKLIEFAKAKSKLIIISSHDLHHITDVCSRIILLEDGKIISDKKTDSATLHELENYFKVRGEFD